ncbi:MAG: CcmD family protein [Chloroflexota bacterium]
MFALSIYLQAWFQTAQQNPGQFNNFLLLAYAAMWLIVIVYVLSLANKQRNLHQEIRLMQRLLKEDEGDE